jgi:hypothetical protein
MPARKKEDAGVVLTVRINPASMEWLNETAAQLGCDRTTLVKMMLAKAKASYAVGWRPRL